MSVDETTVTRVAKLARIRIDAAEAATLKGELNDILGWIEQLGEVDVEGVEPMTSVVDVRPRLREDVINDGADAPAVVANAPASEDHFFMVPKVVE
ncbi:MAG: Asp-tRNA(Asn)/Glu-tRNA(Gln) amidotransferase subunit GatC [Pseudomonadota bacterium]